VRPAATDDFAAVIRRGDVRDACHRRDHRVLKCRLWIFIVIDQIEAVRNSTRNMRHAVARGEGGAKFGFVGALPPHPSNLQWNRRGAVQLLDGRDPSNLLLEYVPEISGHEQLKPHGFYPIQHFKILFPGDVEQDVLDALLEQPYFVRMLAGTDVLVASHHGRENGVQPSNLQPLYAQRGGRIR
jgi:hypothetical protein